MKKLLILIILSFIGCKSAPNQPKIPLGEISLTTPIPHLVRSDSLYLTGFAVGYDTVHCIGGTELVKDKIQSDGLFEIYIKLFKNQEHELILFAKDINNQLSDTTLIGLKHRS